MSSAKAASVRTRFAPSPTGPLHMGGARTALFNYLFSRQESGVFVLRIEDTDKERSREEWGRDITENLEWLGLQWDEFYRQSERASMHRKYLEQLLAEQKAYWCFCTTEELEAMRQDQQSRGEAPRYTGKCSSLSREECNKRVKAGKPAVIRFRIAPRTVSFSDLVRGKVKMDAGLLGDIVIAKDLDTPLYNFTAVVDDYDMAITHVIRGEDHLPNTPKQILLQEALGFPAVEYAHLPLLLGEDKTKLSKRHGDNSVTRFREDGYLQEAVINFLALLGWNPGDEREVFSLEELVKEFSMKKVHKGGAVFNVRRLDWLNGYYIRKKSLEELAALCVPYLAQAGLLAPLWSEEEANANVTGYLGRTVVQKKYRVEETGEEIELDAVAKIVALYQERLKKLSEIPEFVDFFFRKTLDYEKDLLKWKDATDKHTEKSLGRAGELLEAIPEKEWTQEKLSEVLLPEAEKEKNRGYLLWPFRVALTGKEASAGPFETAEVLGKTKTLQRIQEAQEKL